jgi:hypothetical protein
MTWSLLLYDLTFYLQVVALVNHGAYLINVFMSFTFGIAVSLWTNVMTMIVVYIVLNLKSVDILAHFPKYVVAIYSFSVIYASVYFILEDPVKKNDVNEGYNIIRFMSIMLNLLGYVFVVRKLDGMGKSAGKHLRSVQVLAARIKYYPIFQLITRLPVSIFQFMYGAQVSDASESLTGFKALLLFISGLFGPLTGVCYFVIFLRMQPRAMLHFRQLIYRKCICLRGCLADPLDGWEEDEAGEGKGEGGEKGAGADDVECSGAAAAAGTAVGAATGNPIIHENHSDVYGASQGDSRNTRSTRTQSMSLRSLKYRQKEKNDLTDVDEDQLARYIDRDASMGSSRDTDEENKDDIELSNRGKSNSIIGFGRESTESRGSLQGFADRDSRGSQAGAGAGAGRGSAHSISGFSEAEGDDDSRLSDVLRDSN